MNDALWLRCCDDPAAYELLPRWPMPLDTQKAFEINSTAGLIRFIEAKLNGHSHVVELGVFAGVSTIAFARRVGHVVGIDREILPVARRALASFRNVQLIENDSVTSAESIPDRSLDCVYLDTDHTVAQVRGELCAWHRKLKPTGIFAGHDFGAEHCAGVAEAVFERFYSVTVFRDSTWCAPIHQFVIDEE